MACLSVAKILGHVLKILLYSVWGSLRALFSCCLPGKRAPDLSADVCLVTGAGQGLGRQLALQLSDCGATLVLWDIDREKVCAVAEEIKERGREAYAYVVDCSKKEEVYHAAGKVREEVGDVAVLVNNAGIVTGKKILETKDEAVERTFAVNTLAHFWTVKAFLPWMLENNYGHIVSICSILSFQGLPRLSDYSASKAAALSFGESLRYELRRANKTGINVTCVCPFKIRTGLFKGIRINFPLVLRSLSPEEVAQRTIRAMAERQFVVVMPKIFYIASYLKGLLPTEAEDEVLELMGAGAGMDTFVGHQKSD